MRKIKTKAELKSVSVSDFPKTGREEMEMLPLTCGLCYKVSQELGRIESHSLTFQDFNSESHFKDHEMDHEGISLKCS